MKHVRWLLFCLSVILVTNVWGERHPKQELLFTGQALHNGKPIAMYFGVSSRLGSGVFVGTNKRGDSSVSPSVSGRIVIPDSVKIPHDLKLGHRVIFPAGTVLPVVCISRRAFADCSRLTEIVLPNTLLYINDQAFRGCKSLKSITLPPRLKRIYSAAFRDCSRLNRITSMGATPPDTYNDVFTAETLRQATLVLPHGTYGAYHKVMPWSLFCYFFENLP